MELRLSTGCGRPHEQRVAINRGGESLPRPQAGAFGDIQIGGHTRDEQRRGGPHRVEREPPRRNTCARHRVTVPARRRRLPRRRGRPRGASHPVVSNSASTTIWYGLARALPEVRRAVGRREREFRGAELRKPTRRVLAGKPNARSVPRRQRNPQKWRFAHKQTRDHVDGRRRVRHRFRVIEHDHQRLHQHADHLPLERGRRECRIDRRTDHCAIRSANASAAPGAASRIACHEIERQQTTGVAARVAAPYPCRAAVHVIQCLPQRGRLAVPGTRDQDDGSVAAGRR